MENLSDSYTYKNKLYSKFLSIMPIVGIYSIGIPGINLADFILMIFIACNGIVHPLKENKSGKPLLRFIFYIFLIALLNTLLFSYEQITDAAIRTTRISFYLFTVVFMSKNIDKKVLLKWIIIVGTAASIFIVIQYVFYKMSGISISGHIPGLKLYTENYMSADYKDRVSEQAVMRFPSFFLEPAHFSRYVALSLIVTLFCYKGKNKVAVSLMQSLGIVISGSGNGYMVLVIVWGMFLYNHLRKGKITAWQLIYSSFIVIGVVVFLQKNSMVTYVYHRIFDGIQTGESGAVKARTKNFSELMNTMPYLILFGHGFGTVPKLNAWMSDLLYCIWGTGIIGVSILLSFFHRVYKSSGEMVVKTLIFVLMALMVTDDGFNNIMVVLTYSALLILAEKEVVYEEKYPVYKR